MKPRAPKYVIEYAGKNITDDVSQYLERISYSDKTAGQSDELIIELDDTDALWSGPWYPSKGDKITASIGYDDELVPCGDFTVSEIELRFPGDVVVVRGLAAGVDKAVRTKRSTGFENQTLKQIAEAVAKRNGLKVEGDIANIRITRSTQYRETDLEYLRRVSEKFGHYFSVRGDRLVFTNVFKIEGGKIVTRLQRSDIIRGSVEDKTVGTYQSANVKWRNPALNRAVEQAMRESGVPSFNQFLQEQNRQQRAMQPKLLPTKDTLEIYDMAENESQAEWMAAAGLNKANKAVKTARISVIGNPVLLAGNNIELVGLGEFSGVYQIKVSDHAIVRSGGYTTELELEYLNSVPDELKLRPGGPGNTNPNVQPIP